MHRENSFIIAKEGFVVVTTVALITMAVLLLSDSVLMKLLFLALFGGTLYLFKNPERDLDTIETGSIVSACDGVVSSIETLECQGKIKGECYKISITNRLIDTPVLRVPFSGNLELKELYRGVQLAGHSPKAARLNEQAKLMFVESNNSEHKVVVKHLLNRFDLPLAFYNEAGESVTAGNRYGFMLHGTVQIFLPSKARLAVKAGDELKAGETVLGFFGS